MERDCESELSKLNTEQNACIYHFGASVIHGQRSNILRLPCFGDMIEKKEVLKIQNFSRQNVLERNLEYEM